MYFNKNRFSHPVEIHQVFTRWSSIQKLMFGALMSTVAAILQSAGGLLPGIGLFISPFATAPILLMTLISFRTGFLTYLLTLFLLLLIEPSELIIFPFTTGLLGLGLGWAFRTFNSPLKVLLSNGFLLTVGICTPLYGLGFPIFGPAISSFNIAFLFIISLFSFLYSWLWLVFSLYFLRKIIPILKRL